MLIVLRLIRIFKFSTFSLGVKVRIKNKIIDLNKRAIRKHVGLVIIAIFYNDMYAFTSTAEALF